MCCIDECCLVCDDIKWVVGDEWVGWNDGGLNWVDFVVDNVL